MARMVPLERLRRMVMARMTGTCTVAGLELLRAARERRGERERRAMADMVVLVRERRGLQRKIGSEQKTRRM